MIVVAGNEGWALYFSEFSAPKYTEVTGCGGERAVLQLAAVDTDSAGWPGTVTTMLASSDLSSTSTSSCAFEAAFYSRPHYNP